MAALSRKGDANQAGGTIIRGAKTVFANGIAVMRNFEKARLKAILASNCRAMHINIEELRDLFAGEHSDNCYC